jgi:hypothetical protein
MITGSHVIVYSRDADADRAFFSDVLNYPHVDAGGGWLIFKLPPGEVAMHPTDGPQSHELYLMCDDINATIEHLAASVPMVAAAAAEASSSIRRWSVMTEGPLHARYGRHVCHGFSRTCRPRWSKSR